ncbi:CCA-adding enzyme [Listeria costaricensis]|uniref:CCA-adding enzyme n=1 Tax=Listeria costaricensis TaxID=2026604 RepID=UPI001F0927B6|nr:CCA-adding enzyme [Listeria costaricensis]
MTEIRILKDAEQVVFYPKTHLAAVEGLQVASSQADGLLQAADKVKLDGIQAGAERNNVTAEEKNRWDAKQEAILVSPNGQRFKLQVTDDGKLEAVPAAE